MNKNSQVFSCAKLQEYLTPQAASFYTPRLFDTVTSTNSLAKEAARSGADDGQVFLAAAQTAGRGRFARKFYSPSGCGIYLSLLLRPTLLPQDTVLLTTAAAVAMAQAIDALRQKEGLGGHAAIKWVNDVYLDGRKVCGILTEGALSAQREGLAYAVLGVGANVTPPQDGFDPTIRDIAGTVLPRFVADARMRLTAGFLNAFLPLYRSLPDTSFMHEYRRRSFLIGRRVTVHTGGADTREGKAALVKDVGDDGSLLVVYEDGSPDKLQSGEVSIRDF